MNIGVSTDENTYLTGRVVRYLRDNGHKVFLFGAFKDEDQEWVDASVELAKAVAKGKCENGILFCWTGTGSSMAANKVKGARAALCTDPAQAKGAKKWNHANILVMSLALTKPVQAKKIMDAWFSEPYGSDDFDLRNFEKLKKLDGIRKD